MDGHICPLALEQKWELLPDAEPSPLQFVFAEERVDFANPFRRHLLATEDAVREEVLHPDDLASADAIYVCNAVRGKQEVVLVDEGEVIRSCP